MVACAVDAGRVGAAGADRVAGRGRCRHERDRGSGRGLEAGGDPGGSGYTGGGVGGLDDRPKPGRPRKIDPMAIVLATLEPPPEQLGVTHWSSRLLAAQLGVSNFTVATTWKKLGAAAVAARRRSSSPPTRNWKPRSVTWSGSTWTRRRRRSCCASMRSPRSRRWTGPRRSCRCARESRRKPTHDYVRHGTTTLFAALEVATGKVTDACYPRHRHEEFLRFLKHVAKAYPRGKLHIVVDNYATHKHPRRQHLAGAQPADHVALHPDLGVLAEHGRDLLRDHHPPSHPPRHLHQRQRPHRRHRDLHRRLERPLPTIHLDQTRRRSCPTPPAVNELQSRDTS